MESRTYGSTLKEIMLKPKLTVSGGSSVEQPRRNFRTSSNRFESFDDLKGAELLGRKCVDLILGRQLPILAGQFRQH